MKHFFLSTVGFIAASLLVALSEAASNVTKRFGAPISFSRTIEIPNKKSLAKKRPDKKNRDLQTSRFCTAQDIEEGLLLQANDPTSEFYSYYLWGQQGEPPSDIQCQSSVSNCGHYIYEIEGGNFDENTVPTVIPNQPCIRCDFAYFSLANPQCDDYSCDFFTCEASAGRRNLRSPAKSNGKNRKLQLLSPELRFDGVYQSPSTPGEFYYFRFYEIGEVILISSPSSPELLSDWFHSDHEDVSLKGTYNISGTNEDQISMVLTGDAGSITYSGTIDVNGLTLDWESAITGNSGDAVEWTFEPVTFVGEAAAASPQTCSLYGLALFGDLYSVNKNDGHLTMLYNTGISEGYAGATDSNGRFLTMTRNDPTTIHIITLPEGVGGEQCIDTPGWVDIDGDGCSWYEANDAFLNACAEIGDILGASDNCCVCGGGSGGTDPPTTPSDPTPGSCTDTPGWTDVGGDGCDWYETNSDVFDVCGELGAILGADEHCCVCGGGSADGSSTSTSTSAPEPSGTCTDTPGWEDVDGDGCDWYSANNDDLDVCNLIGDLLGASDNCCVCGGGSSSRSSGPSTRQGLSGTTTSSTIETGIPVDAGGVVSMAIDSQDNLFAIVGFPIDFDAPNVRDIYMVDLDNGNTTLLATDVGFLQACAYDTRNDDMYCLEDSSLVQINPYTGFKTTVTTVDYTFGFGTSTGYDEALEYDPCEHKLWMAYSGLASYDLDTGIVTEVTEFDEKYLFGLFVAGDLLGGGSNSSGTIAPPTTETTPPVDESTIPPVSSATEAPEEINVCVQQTRTDIFSIHEVQDTSTYICLWVTTWKEYGYEYTSGVSNLIETTFVLGDEDGGVEPNLEVCTYKVDGVDCNSCALCSETSANLDGFEVDCSNIEVGASTSCDSFFDTIDNKLLVLSE